MGNPARRYLTGLESFALYSRQGCLFAVCRATSRGGARDELARPIFLPFASIPGSMVRYAGGSVLDMCELGYFNRLSGGCQSGCPEWLDCKERIGSDRGA